ncbi:putative ornithine cyclodeaminase [Roseobacter sp. SK209-2-6]|uniref:ornithine cyclodeaminase family protein n=1 Tax=Roseobacter sp. SK209-2-6 TaxID=388739 RepID=UPI0000F3F658|nr:ornithine cyclodeaminase family protein [Roseobacter sp. SK209-2-6]EBA18074.1 putative ornithine cyclodeaminase [Roseobacter sp. SK209-2-6]
MKFIPEEVSAGFASHGMAYDAMYKALIAATETGTVTFPVIQAHGSSQGDTYAIKSSAAAGLAGLKVGSYWPGNEALGLPRHNSIILLFDQSCGRIGAAVEAGRLNAYRTSAADAVAVDALAREDSKTLALFGAGHQASYEARAIARFRPIEMVNVVSINEARGEKFAEDLRNDGIAAQVSPAEEACRTADIIVTATPATAPLFEADWVKPGTHVAGMGADTAGKQEMPPDLFARGRLFCDLPSQSRVIGEFQHAPKNARLTAIGDVLAGRSEGRTSEEEITIFDSSGISVQDLFMAQAILDLVSAHGAEF